MMIEPQDQSVSPKRSWFLVASALAFIFTFGFSVYLQINQSSLQTEFDALQAKKEAMSTPFATGTSTGASDVSSALAVKMQLQKIETAQISWSKILEKIQATVPKLKGTSDSVVLLRSYTGGEDKKLIAAATTRPNTLDPFADVATVIRAFATEPSFKNVFVPSLSKSVTAEGATVLSFSLNFDYQQAKF